MKGGLGKVLRLEEETRHGGVLWNEKPWLPSEIKPPAMFGGESVGWDHETVFEEA